MQPFITGETPRVTGEVDEITEKRPAVEESTPPANTGTRLARWVDAFKHIWPIYLATHIIFLLLTYLVAVLLLNPYGSPPSPLHVMLNFWDRWDTHHFIDIATAGYAKPLDSAFFPLYPLLIRISAFALRSPLLSALFVANIAGFAVLLLLYRLVADEFGEERAERSVLYLAIFPTAFFLAAGYSESLFLLCTLASFYCMRRGHWWLAGLAAFLAGLTRATGVALFVPLCYEYLRQRDFQWRRIRVDALACAGAGLGVAVYAVYCYLRFHDFLAFSHAEAAGWGRQWTLPWQPLLLAAHNILSLDILNFFSIQNVVMLSVMLGVLVVLVLSFVGPWKFARKDWIYPLYAVAIYLFCTSATVTIPSSSPLDSADRYMLAAFPVFIVLAAMGKNRHFHFLYQALGFSLIAFWQLHFLMHRLVL